MGSGVSGTVDQYSNRKNIFDLRKACRKDKVITGLDQKSKKDNIFILIKFLCTHQLFSYILLDEMQLH